MSDNEGTKAGNGKGWTDRQRLAYYFNLVEISNVKLDFINAPRPDGKTVGACRIMVDRLNNTLKPELVALRGVDEEVLNANKKPFTPRKRKAKAEGDEPATPTKRSRKKKSEVKVPDEEEESKVKPELRDEEVDFESET